MPTFNRKHRLWEAYAFPGFRPEPTVRGAFGAPKARVITLVRRSKKRPAAAVGGGIRAGTTAPDGGCGIFPAPPPAGTSTWRSGASSAGAAGR
jgi:hypothetical protein